MGNHHHKAARVVQAHHTAEARRAPHTGRQRGEDLVLGALAGGVGELVQVADVHAHHGADTATARRAPEHVFHLGEQGRARGQAGGRFGALVQAGQARELAVVLVAQQCQHRSNEEVGHREHCGGQPRAQAQASADPHSPWANGDGWRLGHAGERLLCFLHRGERIEVHARGSAGDYRLRIGERELTVRGARFADGRLGVVGALRRDEDNTVRSHDLYAQADWAFAPDWSLNAGLRRAMEGNPKVLLMGEDIGPLGGVFRVTDGLQKDFGEAQGRAWLAFGVILLVTALGCGWLGWRLSRPLRQLQQTAEQLAEGQWQQRPAQALQQRGDEFGALARAMALMANALEQELSARQTLLHYVSHELKNPMTRLRLAVSLLRRRPDEAVLGQLESAVTQLDERLNQVLLLTRSQTAVGRGQRLAFDQLLAAAAADPGLCDAYDCALTQVCAVCACVCAAEAARSCAAAAGLGRH